MAVELGEGGIDTWRLRDEMGVDCGTSDVEYCMLSSLCSAPLPEGADPSAYTPPEAWCALEEAGTLAQTLLWLGFIPGLGTMFLTLLFAAKEIGKVGTYLSKAESQGISMTIQKYIISACWIGLWAFLFVSMVVYAAAVPDGLGVGLITLEASFGVVRLSFLLVSIFGALLIVSLFDMWRADGFIEVHQGWWGIPRSTRRQRAAGPAPCSSPAACGHPPGPRRRPSPWRVRRARRGAGTEMCTGGGGCNGGSWGIRLTGCASRLVRY
jgi:hypothetical protein